MDFLDYRDLQSSSKDKGLPGILIFNPGSLKCYFPSWKGKRTIFRPLPAPIYNDAGKPTGKYDSWRMSAEPFHFSHWIVPVNVIKKWGDQYPISAIADFRKEDGTLVRHNSRIPENTSAFHKVYATVYKAVKNNIYPQWKDLIEGSKDTSPPLSGPRRAAVIQGYLYSHNGNDYTEDPISRVGLVLAGAACDEIEELLNTEKTAYNGDPENLPARFISGDVTAPEPDVGKFIIIDPREQTRKVMGGYDVKLETDPNGLTNDQLNTWVDWFGRNSQIGSLNIMTYTEQVQLCMKAVRKEVVLATFRDDGVLPDSYTNNRTIVDMSSPAVESVKPVAKPAMPVTEELTAVGVSNLQTDSSATNAAESVLEKLRQRKKI